MVIKPNTPALQALQPNRVVVDSKLKRQSDTPSDGLIVRTVSRFDPATNDEVEISRQVSPDGEFAPELVPPDATVEVATFTKAPKDKERHYQDRERLLTDGQPVEPSGPPSEWKTPQDALYLANKTTVHYSGNAPAVLFEERLQTGPDHYQVTLLDGEKERSRFVKQDFELAVAQKEIAKEVQAKKPEQVRQRDLRLMKSRGAFLKARYGERTDLDILEIGPGTTGVVPRVLLTNDDNNRYIGLDISKEALEMQQEVLTQDGVGNGRMQTAIGDASKSLPVADESQDLILGYASIGVWSSTESAVRQFDEFARALKPGGEVLVGGVGLEYASPVAIARIFDKFELVPQKEEGQSVDMILKKKARRPVGPTHSTPPVEISK